jgi:hypothetical protein
MENKEETYEEEQERERILEEAKIKAHRQKYIELHNALDELFADYISNHPTEHGFSEMPIIKLLKWSYEQTQKQFYV